jgi:hypothetical protein
VFVNHINTASIAYPASREAFSIVFEHLALEASLGMWEADILVCNE